MMTRPNTLKGLLQLVEASDGAIETRIKIQKLAYLLALQGYSEFRPFKFFYHNYGPYSRELSDTLQFATAAGLLAEDKAPVTDNISKYTYRLTEAGRAFLKETGSSSNAFASLIKKLQAHNWRALELAATVRFLEAAEAISDRGKAFQAALDLKPETKAYSKEAESILAEIS
ncbi:MAG: hypothetical protein HXY30_18300 [Pseudorhodoplanes sp.]|nr:hypothetical protein [Pseudorhodoplanes sp.]